MYITLIAYDKGASLMNFPAQYQWKMHICKDRNQYDEFFITWGLFIWFGHAVFFNHSHIYFFTFAF